MQIDQQELAITNAREYDVLQHRPQKKSYKENQLGDITDVMKTEPQPDDKAGREAWIDRCSWGGILPSLDAIICMELFVFLLGFPLWHALSAPSACTLVAALCLLHPDLMIHHLPLLYMQLRSSAEPEGTRGGSLI